MSKEKIYDFCPQMKDYNAINLDFFPFTMWFNSANFRSQSVNTDNYGFRKTFFRDTNFSFSKFFDSYNNGVVVGSSTCFGVGSSSDKYTIPSLMNDSSPIKWFNMGGKSFNSTQELIIFQLFAPKSIKKVVIFSGINNLSLAFKSNKSSPFLSSYFNESLFQYILGFSDRNLKGSNSRQGQKYIGKYVSLNKLRHDFINASTTIFQDLTSIIQKDNNKLKSHVKRDLDKNYSDTISYFERDMRLWKYLSDSLKFDLYFIMQPVALWLDKEFTNEEKELFDILDKKQSKSWLIIEKYFQTNMKKYLDDIEKICKKLGVNFLDINSKKILLKDEWYFVDRVHLTDLGYKKVRDEILRVL